MDERLVKALERIAAYLPWVVTGELVIALLVAAILVSGV